jgi:predicted acylesterase/phospholipase RssA
VNSKDRDTFEPIVLKYENCIGIEHNMESSTLPDVYDPMVLCNRKFWDGSLLSNTLLNELLESHRDYWIYVENND